MGVAGCSATSDADAGGGVDVPALADAPEATDAPSDSPRPVEVGPPDAPAPIDAPTLDAPSASDAGGRTVITEPCARVFGTCTQDTDCRLDGCGGEMCASESVASTCDCTAVAGSCGCVDGRCAWYR